VQLENNIVKEKYQQSAAKKINPNWISNMRTFGEMAIIARHSNNLSETSKQIEEIQLCLWDIQSSM
jgi:hypothetical protein